MQNKKGITLIALILTIILMLILLGVSVTTALNGGLFNSAEDAVNKTQKTADLSEIQAAVVMAIGSDGRVDFNKLNNTLPDGFTKIADRIYKSSANNTFTINEIGDIELAQYNENIQGLPNTVTVVAYNDLSSDLKSAVDAGKIKTVLREGTTTAVVPTGFEISKETGENTISGGLVITDGTNEFVWIPVTTDFSNNEVYTSTGESNMDLVEPYSDSSYDTQPNLDKYYGTGYYTYSTNFNYTAHYTEMKQSVNKYDGFYVGRYETTIDSNKKIGSKADTTVLTQASILKNGNNVNDNNNPFYYRWWGMYDSQRNSSIIGNGNFVQTSMIWGQQWNAMLTFLGSDATSTISGTQTSVLKSGKATYDNSRKDVIKNIYDLRRNVREMTPELTSSAPCFSSTRGRILF